MTAPAERMPSRAIIAGKQDEYRYSLIREIQDVPYDCISWVTWVMLNPSTADAETDDPTIRRVLRFSRDAGYTHVEVVNLFAWRATDPSDLVHPANIYRTVGPHNWAYQMAAARNAHRIVCAWGNGKFSAYVAGLVFDGAKRSLVRALAAAQNLLGRKLEVACYGTTASGEPRHPLYLKADTQPIRFGWGALGGGA